MGRICCAELGVGWVVLEIKWKLLAKKKTDTKEQDGQEIVVCEGTKKLRDSGGIGFIDMCESDFGENILLKVMAPDLAREIVDKLYPRDQNIPKP